MTRPFERAATRRRFVQGLAAGGVLASAGAWLPRRAAQAASVADVSTLRGPVIDLDRCRARGELHGRHADRDARERHAAGPDPALARGRGRHAARAQRAQRRYRDPLARRAHAVEHGRRAGPELPRDRARRLVRLSLSRAPERHVLVSRARGVPGTDRRLRRDRDRAARARAVQVRPRARRAALRLDRSRSARPLPAAQAPLRLLQLQPAHARGLRARQQARGIRQRARGSLRVGADADDAGGSRGRRRPRVHVSRERPDDGRQLDGALRSGRARALKDHQRLRDDDVRRADPGPRDDGRRGRRPIRAAC